MKDYFPPENKSGINQTNYKEWKKIYRYVGKPKKVLESRVKENTLKIKKCKNRMLSYNSTHKWTMHAIDHKPVLSYKQELKNWEIVPIKNTKIAL